MKKSVLALLLVLVACAPASQTAPVNTDFRTGTQGLVFSFVPNLPPPTLYGGDTFNALLQVENKGTSKLTFGQIYLSGFDKNIIRGTREKESIPALNGRDAYVSQGDIGSVPFNGDIDLSTQLDRYQPTLLATACYLYETVAGAQVCIDPNPFAPTSVQKVCVPSTVNTGSQGAPIAVTRVDVEPAKGKTRFKIYISNVGGGEVFKSSEINNCPNALKFNDLDVVDVVEVRLSETSIKSGTTFGCKPSPDSVRLVNGQAVLFCEADSSIISGTSAYLSPLNVILKYGYRQSITKPIEIKPAR